LKRRTLTIALAGILALVGVVAVLAYARNANNRAVAGLQAETVLAAKKSIPADTPLASAQQQGLLTTEKVPVASLGTTQPVHSVTAAYAHLVTSANVAAGQLVLQNMLESASAFSADTGASGASTQLQPPSGKVAVTVLLCASEAVADYLVPDSQVIIYATIPTSASSGIAQQCGVSHAAEPQGDANTQEVMGNITVLSVTAAQSSSSSPSTGSSSSSAVADPVSSQLAAGVVAVTFAVDPGQQAENLIEAAQLYVLYLALEPAAAGAN
jgi:pilus assembly protein CpaB